jgi:hypothetical protein
MSKFAVRGLSLSLHHLTAPTAGIRVCVVMPGPVDTPIFARAANHTGRRLRAIAPAMAPERVAAAIVACARRPRRSVVIGFTSYVTAGLHWLLPAPTEWLAARIAAASLVTHEPAEDTAGGLFEWAEAAREHGGCRRNTARRRLGEAVGRALAHRGA